MFLEEFKYVVKEKKRFLSILYNISSDFDRENSDEENSDEENSDVENSDEENSNEGNFKKYSYNLHNSYFKVFF